MKRACVTVPWPEGLHLRPAATLVKVARNFRSRIRLRCGEKIADLQSVVSVIMLCATLGMTLEIEVTGDDEQAAAEAVERVFSSLDGGDNLGTAMPDKR